MGMASALKLSPEANKLAGVFFQIEIRFKTDLKKIIKFELTIQSIRYDTFV